MVAQAEAGEPPCIHSENLPKINKQETINNEQKGKTSKSQASDPEHGKSVSDDPY